MYMYMLDRNDHAETSYVLHVVHVLYAKMSIMLAVLVYMFCVTS